MTIVLFLLSVLFAQQPGQPEFGSLSGQLRGGNGEVAAGVRVAAAPVEAGVAITKAPTELSNIVQTDGEGRYRLENVRPGRYWIIAGSLTSPRYYPEGATPDKGRIVTVAAGQAISNLDFTVGPSSFPLIAGTARFDDNTPVTSGAVYLRLQFNNPGGGQIGSASLDPRQPGVLVISGIDAPGTYTVTADQLPLGYYVQSMTYGSTDLIRDPLILAAKLGNPLVDVVLTKTRPARMPPGVKVSGRLFNRDPASPNSSHLITLYKFQDNASFMMSLVDTMDDGSFEIDDVQPGRYALLPGLPMILRPNYSGTFEVGRADVINLEIGKPASPVSPKPNATTNIQGTVDVAAIDGGTIPEFEIQFVPTQQGAETRTVKISGKQFSVLLPQGAYRVRSSGLPTGYASSVIAGPMDLTEPFLVSAGGIADRFTGIRVKSDGIIVKLSKPGTN